MNNARWLLWGKHIVYIVPDGHPTTNRKRALITQINAAQRLHNMN